MIGREAATNGNVWILWKKVRACPARDKRRVTGRPLTDLTGGDSATLTDSAASWRRGAVSQNMEAADDGRVLAMLAWLAGRSGCGGLSPCRAATAQATEPLGSCITVLRGRRESSACARSPSNQAVRGAAVSVGVLLREGCGVRDGDAVGVGLSRVWFGEVGVLDRLMVRTAWDSFCRWFSLRFHLSPGVTMSMKLRSRPDLKSLAASSAYIKFAYLSAVFENFLTFSH
jgi:hypothetical protein